MRILHYVPGIWLKQGGVVRTIIDLAELLTANGDDVHVTCYVGPDIPPSWLSGVAGKPRATLINPPAYPLNLFATSEVEKMSAAIRNADVFHLHGPWLNGNLQFAAQAKRLGVPYVVTLHGMLNRWTMQQGGTWRKKLFMRVLGTRFLEEAALVHVTSESELDEVRPWIRSARTFVAPCPFDLGPYSQLPGPALARQRFNITTELPSFLFLSRIHPQKGLDIAVRAMAKLKSAGRRCQLLVAGEGDDENMRLHRALVKELDLDDEIRFLGMVTGEMKLSLYQAADVFVLPTRHENFGLVLIEAMASGIPIITTRNTNIWSDLQSAGATIVEPEPAAVADALWANSQNSPSRLAKVRQAQDWVRQTFFEQNIVAKYNHLYQQAIKMSI